MKKLRTEDLAKFMQPIRRGTMKTVIVNILLSVIMVVAARFSVKLYKKSK